MFISQDMKKVLLILLMAILSSSLVSATYIKGDIIIKPNGDAELKLETDKTLDIQGIEQIENKISGTTSALTSKDGELWTFNIDFGEFDEIFIVISLPKNLQEVTSIEGSKNIIDFVFSIFFMGKVNTMQAPFTLGSTQILPL